jgi:hypothetical protein
MGSHLGNGFGLLDETVRGDCVAYDTEVNERPGDAVFDKFEVIDKEVLTPAMNVSARYPTNHFLAKQNGRLSL